MTARRGPGATVRRRRVAARWRRWTIRRDGWISGMRRSSVPFGAADSPLGGAARWHARLIAAAGVRRAGDHDDARSQRGDARPRRRSRASGRGRRSAARFQRGGGAGKPVRRRACRAWCVQAGSGAGLTSRRSVSRSGIDGLPELGHGAVQERARVGGADAEDVGDLGVGEIGVVLERDHFAVAWRRAWTSAARTASRSAASSAASSGAGLRERVRGARSSARACAAAARRAPRCGRSRTATRAASRGGRRSVSASCRRARTPWRSRLRRPRCHAGASRRRRRRRPAHPRYSASKSNARSAVAGRVAVVAVTPSLRRSAGSITARARFSRRDASCCCWLPWSRAGVACGAAARKEPGAVGHGQRLRHGQAA